MLAKRWFALVAATLGLALLPAATSGQSCQASGRLVVSETFDPSAGVYVEGYKSFVAVRRGRSGPLVFRAGRVGSVGIKAKLAIDEYWIRSYVRPCDGNCQTLDPATNGCSTTFRLRQDEIVKVKIRRNAKRCRISIDRAS